MFNFIEYWILMKHEVTRTRNRLSCDEKKKKKKKVSLEALGIGAQSAQPFIDEYEKWVFSELSMFCTFWIDWKSIRWLISVSFTASVSEVGLWRFDTSNRELSFLLQHFTAVRAFRLSKHTWIEHWKVVHNFVVGNFPSGRIRRSN